ncbi:MAG TPA: hypothetical protein VGN42_14345 [Pirellulales bacterium]|nr:hypothetical protein [Pirellulales bacterium]
MLEDVIESLVDLVEGAEPATATKAAGHKPRPGQEPLGLEQLEDRLLMAADAETAAEPLAPQPQEPAPAEAVAGLAPAAEISTSPAPKTGPASAESLDGAPEIAAELEHELASHLHDGEGQIGPGDGRIANRAGSEGAEVNSERSGESSHEATLEEHESEERSEGESEKALEELELSTAEERSRVDASGVAGELASSRPSEDPTQSASETTAGMLSTAGAPGSMVIDLEAGSLGTELSTVAAIDGGSDSESEPDAKDADLLGGEAPGAASDPAQTAPEARRHAEAGDPAADGPETGDRSQPSPLAENRSAPVAAAGDQVATEQDRAHDACFSAARQTTSIEEAVAEAVVPDAASPKP